MRQMKAIDPVEPVKFLSQVAANEINMVRPAFQSTYGIVNRMQDVCDDKQGNVQEN